MASTTAVAARNWFATLQTRLSSGEVEALKWLALLAMVADHVDLLLFGRSVPWLHDVGRAALPLFALVFGYNVARWGVDPLRVGLRIVPVALLSSAVWYATGAAVPLLNVLWAFALFAFAVNDWQAGRRWWAVSVLVLAGLVSEGGWFTFGISLAGFWIYRRPADVRGYLGAVAAVAALEIVNGSAWAMLAVPLVLAVRWWRPQLPHLRGVFLWIYPAHVALLGAWAQLVP